MLKPYITRIPDIGVRKNGHESRFAGLVERCGHGLVVDRKIRVTVKHKESVGQESGCFQSRLNPVIGTAK